MHFIHSDSKNHIGISIWLLILSIMAFLMIVIGGLTRLTGSGLSMVNWNPIMGTIPPLSHLAWMDVFDNYKATPEFQIVNNKCMCLMLCCSEMILTKKVAETYQNGEIRPREPLHKHRDGIIILYNKNS